MLNQIRLSGQGDLYIPGSPEYMEKARKASNMFFLTLDLDDDGVADSSEKLRNIKTVPFKRR